MVTATEQNPPTPDREGIFLRLDLSGGFPYTFTEYARRAMWLVVYTVLIRFSPGRLSAWRRFWLRLFGAKVGHACNIRPTCRIRHPWLLEVGDWSCLADNVEVYNLGPIRIGDHTVVSQNAHLCNGTHDYRVPAMPLVRPTMTIGSGIWICADSFIGPGVTVGDNSIVGARAVVTRDVPAGVIVAGNPATVVKDRPFGPQGLS